MILDEKPEFRPLAGLYEPSAIQQLPDGRFLVVEDEKQHPFSLLTLAADGRIDVAPLQRPTAAAEDGMRKLDDLEGLTLDRAGRVYAITSHSRDGDGDAKRSRDKLVRFRVEGDRMLDAELFTGLKPALAAAYPVLAAAAAVADVKNDGGLNIEALEMSPDPQRLLIGLRSPLLDNRAIVASLDNPDAIFAAGEAPRFPAALQTIDLDGDGIRGMSHVPALGGYLVIGGPAARQQVQFRLWFWSGREGEAARRVSVPGLPGLEHAEGLCPAIIAGQPRIIVVSDDGSREAGRCARFLLLAPEQLRIAT